MIRYEYELQPRTRQEEQDLNLPMHEHLRRVRDDLLAWRWLMLRVHGRETLINIIRAQHGLPNRY